jgi:plasmid stabilization system protein ParE
MSLTVYWLPQASKRLGEINNYLKSEFGSKVEIKFNNKLFNLVDTISKLPKIGTLRNKKLHIRSYVVVKQITIFYKVKKNEIVILNLHDNRQNPKNRKY